MADAMETVIKVKVLPRSSRNAIVGRENGVYRVKMTDPPVEGRANRALVDFLSEKLGIAKSHIEITAGKTSRLKRVKVRGMSDAAVTRALDANT
jgi:uncharacterized protein (TIGR00251 family)